MLCGDLKIFAPVFPLTAAGAYLLATVDCCFANPLRRANLNVKQVSEMKKEELALIAKVQNWFFRGFIHK